jgi:putative beta-barrel porin BBP2
VCAQETVPVDPLDSMPIRLGPVGLTPTFAVTDFGIDTNVFNDSVDPQRDFTFTATPKVQARLRSGRLILGGILATGLVYYQKFDDQRSIDYSAQGRGDADLGWFQPYAFAERLDTRDRLSAELDLRAPRVSTAVEGGGKILMSSTTGVRFSARRTSVAFEDGQEFDGVFLSETLNSHTTILEGGLDLNLTPLTTLSVMVSGQQDRFESRPDRDSDSFKVMPTIRLESPAIIQGSLAIGYRRFEGRTDALPDYAGVVYQGALSHVIAERTKVDVGLSRDVQYSFEMLEPYYVTTAVRLGLTHQLRETIDIRGVASNDRLDYRAQPSAEPASSRLDRVRMFSAGAGFLVRPNVRVGFDLEFTRRRSERADRQYERTRLLGSASYGF